MFVLLELKERDTCYNTATVRKMFETHGFSLFGMHFLLRLTNENSSKASFRVPTFDQPNSFIIANLTMLKTDSGGYVRKNRLKIDLSESLGDAAPYDSCHSVDILKQNQDKCNYDMKAKRNRNFVQTET